MGVAHDANCCLDDICYHTNSGFDGSYYHVVHGCVNLEGGYSKGAENGDTHKKWNHTE